MIRSPLSAIALFLLALPLLAFDPDRTPTPPFYEDMPKAAPSKADSVRMNAHRGMHKVGGGTADDTIIMVALGFSIAGFVSSQSDQAAWSNTDETLQITGLVLAGIALIVHFSETPEKWVPNESSGLTPELGPGRVALSYRF
jgi:hypothetical protein